MSIEHEDAVLYLAMWGGAAEAMSATTLDDFTPGDRQDLFVIIERGYTDNILHPAWVMDEAIRVGRPSPAFVASISTAGFTGSIEYYAVRLREETVKRHAIATLTRGLTALNRGASDPTLIIEDVKAELDAVPSPATNNDDTWTLADIMGLTVETTAFTIPNMLRRNERLVLTGSEGGGKSVFVYQLLTGAAFGVDTLAMERTEPKRVLFLDVENNEFQARANLDKIVPALREVSDTTEPEWRSLKRRVIDLLASKDRADLIRRVVHYKPDILYMGTAYKLTDVADETHRSVRAIQSVVDRIRQEIDCSVIVEHHAGHGTQNDRNNMRPEGSSYWMRWPDFGKGMQPLKSTNGGRLMRIASWRGDRATDRNFPVAVRQGETFPWVPVYQDEWDALYARIHDNVQQPSKRY